MASDLELIAGLLLYTLVSRAVLSLTGAWRLRLFALVNIVTVGALFYAKVRPYTWTLGVYLVLVALHWVLVRHLARQDGKLPWIAFSYPIVLLVLIRFIPPLWMPLWRGLAVPHELQNAAFFFVGISYMAFRLSWLVIEVRNGIVESPSLAHYLGFAFFAPTIMVGPISRFSRYDASIRTPSRAVAPLRSSCVRAIVGVTKYVLLANAANQIAYAGLVLDGRPHALVDWIVSSAAYYIFLYCNFSGFCDIAIGIGAILGIKIDENFDNPFAARNVQVLWNRWHMTLGAYMRDVLFTPLSKTLIARFGPARSAHAIAISIFTLFVVIGVWHGPTANFILFGIINGLALVLTHYYGIALKRRLSKDALRRYHRSKAIRAIGVVATFIYFSIALGVFANTKSLARNVDFFRHRVTLKAQ